MGPNAIVRPGRREQILAESKAKDCEFICHKSTIAGRHQIACKGHTDATGGGAKARFYRELGMVQEFDPDTLQPVGGIAR